VEEELAPIREQRQGQNRMEGFAKVMPKKRKHATPKSAQLLFAQTRRATFVPHMFIIFLKIVTKLIHKTIGFSGKMQICLVKNLAQRLVCWFARGTINSSNVNLLEYTDNCLEQWIK
jgi:hypothetical protein